MIDYDNYYTFPKKVLINLVWAGGLLLNVIVHSSLMKFYTDVVGFSSAIFGVVIIIFGIWNGVNDPIIGFWADNRKFGKHGKYLVLIRWSIPILVFSSVLLFVAQPDWPTTLTAVFLLVLLIIYEGGKTMLDISFNAFKINAFLSMKERSQIQVIGSYVAMIPVFVGGMIPIWFLTGDFTQNEIAGIFAGCVTLGVILIFIGSLFIKENPSFYMNNEESTSLKESFSLLKILIKDKVFVLFTVAFIFITTSAGNSLVGYMYYMDNILHVSGLKATIPDVLTGVAQMATLPFLLVLTKKIGSRNGYIIWSLFSIAGFMTLYFNVGYYVVAISYILILIGVGAFSSLQYPMQGLVIDHIEIKTGIRKPAGIAGLMLLFFLPAYNIQQLVLGILLDNAGYDGSVTVQTEAVETAIRIGTGLFPAIILAIGLIILYLVPIDKNREGEILNEMEHVHKSHNDIEQSAVVN